MPRRKETSRPRIVSLAPSVTSTLFSIGARRDVIGVTKWCKDVAPVGRLPQVGDCWKLNIADVMNLHPTLLIGSVPFSPEAIAQILQQPVAFLALNPRSLADIEANIRTLGRLTNRAPAAEKLIALMRGTFASIAHRAAIADRATTSPSRIHTAPAASRRLPPAAGLACESPPMPQRVASLPRHRVYCEAWPNPRISSPPWVAELVSIAGGEFVTKPGTRIADEDVARANPDLIVLAWTATAGRSDPSRALRNSAWQDTPAVRNGRVVVIRDELLNTPGPPLMDGAHALFRAIHAR